MARPDVKQMLEGMRAQLEKDEAEGRLAGLTVADLADAIAHPKAAGAIEELMVLEASSVQEGDAAPDFSLPWIPGPGAERVERLTLSSRVGRPVALVFGSYT